MKKYLLLSFIFFNNFLFSTELMILAENNDLMAIQRSVQKGIDINESDSNGFTALHIAAWNGFTDMTRYLLEMGANPNIISKAGNTPLKFATPATAELLIKYGAFEEKEIIQPPPMYYTKTVYIEQPSKKIINVIKPKETSIDSDKREEYNLSYPKGSYNLLNNKDIEESASLHGWDKNGNNNIHKAAQAGDIEKIKKLIAAGVNPNTRNGNGDTALRFATENGDLETVKYLVEKVGLDINTANNEGTTPLLMATVKNDLAIMRYLIKMGANVNASANALVERTVNGVISNFEISGWTPLMAAAQIGHKEAVDLLLYTKSDLNGTDSDHWTALMFAVQNKHTEIAKKLIDAGINYNIESKDNCTALSLATDNHDNEMIALLKGIGANPSSVPLVSYDEKETEVVENVQVEDFEYYEEDKQNSYYDDSDNEDINYENTSNKKNSSKKNKTKNKKVNKKESDESDYSNIDSYDYSY